MDLAALPPGTGAGWRGRGVIQRSNKRSGKEGSWRKKTMQEDDALMVRSKSNGRKKNPDV